MNRARKDRAQLRAGLLATGGLHDDVLEAAMVGKGTMAAPAKLVKRRSAAGHSEYRSTGAGDYDWFYKLSRREQARLRGGWFAPAGTGESPDEVAERMPISKWLEHTRHSDAARAVASGRHLQSDRYGGLTGQSLVRDQRDHPPAADGTRFYTNTDGEVIPISPPKPVKAHRVDYGADEAF
jgi:hypothetical protein